MKYFQYNIKIKPRTRGFHLITSEIESQLLDLHNIKIGIAHLFIQHTSASLSINENYDPDVRIDFENSLNRIFPENYNLYNHTDEGLDDITSHLKCSVIGNSLTIPISDGKLNLGSWQGIYLGEHRNFAKSRNIIATIWGN